VNIKIVVSSLGNIKILAVNKAAEKIFAPSKNHTSHKINVIGTDASSLIDEQPEGLEAGFTGAENRLLCALGREPDADYWVAIENCIHKIVCGDEIVWLDIACIMVCDKKGNISRATSVGIQFPTELVEEARKLGFDKYNVGYLIAKRFNCDPKNPQSYLTDFLLGRSTTLEDAVVAGFGQLFRSTRNTK
jgi:non-canonical (house-cleaning) NTP pyrophosphatase